MVAGWSAKLNSLFEKVFPFLFLTLCFTAPFAKAIAGHVYMICIILFVIQMFFRREYQTGAKAYYLAALVYLALILLSLTYTTDIAEGFLHYKQQCKMLIGVILIERVSSTESAHRYLYAFAAGGAVLASIGIYQGLVLKISRPPTLYHPVHGGSLLVISSIVLIALLLSETSFVNKALITTMLAIHGVALYLNGSRGAWVALAAVLLLVPFIHFNLSMKRRIIYVLSLFLIVMVACKGNFFHDRIREAKDDIIAYTSSKSDTSLGARFEMWKASALMFKENPLLGIGTGGWEREMKEMVAQHRAPAYIKQFNQPHSIYLDALSTKGLIGLVSLLLLIACPVYYALKCREPETMLFRNVVILVAIAFFISGMTDTIIRFRFVFMSYNLVMGLGLAVLVRSCAKTNYSPAQNISYKQA